MKITSGPTTFVLFDGRHAFVFYSREEAEAYRDHFEMSGMIMAADSFKEVTSE